MKNTFVIFDTEDWGNIQSSLFTPDGNENAGVLLCGISESDKTHRFLVRYFLPVEPGHYRDRSEYHLEVSPAFYNAVIDRCLKEKLVPILIHSHPHHKGAWFSASDDFGERRLLNVFRALVPPGLQASLVVTPTAVAGRTLVNEGFVSLTGLVIVGRRCQVLSFSPSVKRDASERHDRQLRAFGKEGQHLLESLKIGIVGFGGIGSLVGEQLARAGARDFTLVDHDEVEASNLSRLFGASEKSIGIPKVEIGRQHLTELGATEVKAIHDSAIKQSVLFQLRDRHIIFSCVDNDRTRAFLNRLAYQYLIPTIELGVRIDARAGQVKAAAGRAALVGSGLTCLRCSGHLNAERIRAESLPKKEREELAKEGYVMGVDEPAPAVVSLNTVIAGLGVTAALNLFVNLTGALQPVEQLYDATSGEVFTVTATHEPGCDICDGKKGIKALGDLQRLSAYD